MTTLHLKEMGNPDNLLACFSLTAIMTHVPRNTIQVVSRALALSFELKLLLQGQGGSQLFPNGMGREVCGGWSIPTVSK